MSFLVKCLDCGNIDKRFDSNNIPKCSSCNSANRIPVCTACLESIQNQDVKDCNGMIIHDNRRCWSIQWNK